MYAFCIDRILLTRYFAYQHEVLSACYLMYLNDSLCFYVPNKLNPRAKKSNKPQYLELCLVTKWIILLI